MLLPKSEEIKPIAKHIEISHYRRTRTGEFQKNQMGDSTMKKLIIKVSIIAVVLGFLSGCATTEPGHCRQSP